MSTFRPLESGDVPQANSVRRLVELIHGLADGKVPTSFRHKRDRAFYFKAARALDLVQGKSLTERGKELARLDGAHLASGLRAAFEESRVGRTWLEWQRVTSIDGLDPMRAAEFLAERSSIAKSTQRRRASTLTRWVRALQQAATGTFFFGRRAQLSLFETSEWRKWPAVSRFPHNEAAQRVRDVLGADFQRATEWLLITGYSSLDLLLQHLAARPERCTSVRLLLGTEPFGNASNRSRTARRALPDEIRDYWLSEGISVLRSGDLIAVRESIEAGAIEVRTAPMNKPIHAKMYVADESVTLGSSNYTPNGLGRQSEANVRFEIAEKDRLKEAKNLAEGLWSLGQDYTEGFLQLLDELLQQVTWQEALARGCAAVLEGEWARKYVRPELVSDLPDPLWPHQVQGISQAMWVLENVGAALVADAAGSGKTRMGAWLVRAAFDRQFRFGFTVRPSPLIVTPPAVVDAWQRGLDEAYLRFRVDSHGPLSNARSANHEQLLKAIEDTELLAVDEAHNFLNPSSRTLRLVSHYAENAILFTATPINRSAADLLALVDMLGADNLSDASRATLNRLRRRGLDSADEADLALIREEIRRFTVRRTRAQLNQVADAHPEKYQLRSGRRARYPKHRALYYDCGAEKDDLRLIEQIAHLADQLRGVTRIPAVLELQEGWTGTPEAYLDRVVASARALARYHVMKCLRSSRAALFEHVHGTDAAFERYGPGHHASRKNRTGNMCEEARARGATLPEWKLLLSQSAAPDWLVDRTAFLAACNDDASLYGRIGELTERLTDERERKKLAHLQRLGSECVALAFDSHVITLVLFHDALKAAGVDVGLFTGEGGNAAKRRATAELGLSGSVDRFVALCSDAFSEGMNLQKARSVVHLDTPTVIRLAEQRAGRVDRMDSPHDEVQIWWPQDPPALAPQRRDLLRERHEMVADLIGANLQLPTDKTEVDIRELAKKADIERDRAVETETQELYDAFRGVRTLVEPGGLVPPSLYADLRKSQARIQSCVSTVQSDAPWAFFVVGGAGRHAPQWVFFGSPTADPIHDLSAVASELRKRLGASTRDMTMDRYAVEVEQAFIERLRSREGDLLPPRRRRALDLLQSTLTEWSDDENLSEGDREAYTLLSEWLFPAPEARRQAFADPRSIADAWLALIRPRLKNALRSLRRRRRFWTIDQLSDDLRENPFTPEQLNEAFSGVPNIQPVDQRVVAMILGVPPRPKHG